MGLYDNQGGGTNWKEQHLYGSSRLGIWHPGLDLNTSNGTAARDTTGNKSYELVNHLGNVMATISDKRLQQSSDGEAIDWFDADVQSAQEYYAFGPPMRVRSYSAGKGSYRYGFNGKENDNEVKKDGDGNPNVGSQQDYGMRIYDPRLGRFLSVDPLSPKYPELTPYQFASNSPIAGIDLDGLEFYWTANGAFLGHIGKSQEVYTADQIKGGIAVNPSSLNVMHDQFIKNSSVVYGESSHADWEEANAIASIYVSGRNRLSYALKDPLAIKFRSLSDQDRNNNTAMKQSISATIAFYNGIDVSNNADSWDGAEQAMFGKDDLRRSTGKYELHMNTMGWKISDNNYKSWKAAIGKNFKAPQIRFAPNNYSYLRKGKIVNYDNKDEIHLLSVGQYGKTMFWKTLNGKETIKKPQ